MREGNFGATSQNDLGSIFNKKWKAPEMANKWINIKKQFPLLNSLKHICLKQKLLHWMWSINICRYNTYDN